MSILCRLLMLLMVIAAPTTTHADSAESTRVTDPNQHNCVKGGPYPYREKADYVLKELDLKPGDVVVDIGAGDGWWAQKMAKFVGPNGAIHASEIEQQKVDRMKEYLAGVPQVKPYLCQVNGTGLDENTCDLAFLSKTYHHFDKGSHVDYLLHLRRVVKPSGRLCVIEKHPAIGGRGGSQHAWSPALLMKQAEEAGWVAVRYELMTGTYHYITIFIQKDMFGPEPRQKRRAEDVDE